MILSKSLSEKFLQAFILKYRKKYAYTVWLPENSISINTYGNLQRFVEPLRECFS